MSESIEEGLKTLQFLKKRKEEAKINRQDKKIILLERRQINKDNPAIAQLRIEFPDLHSDFKEYVDSKISKFPLNHVHKFIENSLQSFIIEIQGVKLMYSWFEYFIQEIKKDYRNYEVEVSGVWDKFD